MSIATAVNPRTLGPLFGPIALAGVDCARKAFVDLDAEALRDAMSGHSPFRQFLPVGAKVISYELRVDFARLHPVVRVVFTKPSPRELANGELLPEYKLHDSPNGGYWWEECGP